jgi:hypothetical protein
LADEQVDRLRERGSARAGEHPLTTAAGTEPGRCCGGSRRPGLGSRSSS